MVKKPTPQSTTTTDNPADPKSSFQLRFYSKMPTSSLFGDTDKILGDLEEIKNEAIVDKIKTLRPKARRKNGLHRLNKAMPATVVSSIVSTAYTLSFGTFTFWDPFNILSLAPLVFFALALLEIMVILWVWKKLVRTLRVDSLSSHVVHFHGRIYDESEDLEQIQTSVFQKLAEDSPGPSRNNASKLNMLEQPTKEYDEPSQVCFICNSFVPSGRTYHCGSCNKCVGSFDHHCAMLNTCISARNYYSFFGLIRAASVLYVMNLGLHAFAVLASEDPSRPFQVWSGIVFFLQAYQLFLASRLVQFHIFLLANKVTTLELHTLKERAEEDDKEAASELERLPTSKMTWKKKARTYLSLLLTKKSSRAIKVQFEDSSPKLYSVRAFTPDIQEHLDIELQKLPRSEIKVATRNHNLNNTPQIIFPEGDSSLDMNHPPQLNFQITKA